MEELNQLECLPEADSSFMCLWLLGTLTHVYFIYLFVFLTLIMKKKPGQSGRSSC